MAKRGRILFLFILHVGIDQQGIGFRMDVFHHDLESVEELGLGILHLIDKVLGQVLIHNSVRGGKKGKDMLDEVSLVFVEFVVPVTQVLMQIDLFCGPETSLAFFIPFPQVVMFYGKNHKSVLIFL